MNCIYPTLRFLGVHIHNATTVAANRSVKIGVVLDEERHKNTLFGITRILNVPKTCKKKALAWASLASVGDDEQELVSAGLDA